MSGPNSINGNAARRGQVRFLILGLGLLLMLNACGSGMVLEQAEFAQPLESVLSVEQGDVHDPRTGIRFSVDPILNEEGAGDVPAVRLIRHRSGLYMLTATGFQHVWYLESGLNQFKVVNQHLLRESGLGEPIMNQRGESIELVDQSTGHRFLLNEEGVITEGDQ